MDLENINPINNHIIDEVTNTIVVEAVAETVEEPIVAIEEPIVAIEEPIVAIEEPIVAIATILDLLSNMLNVKGDLEKFNKSINPQIKECLLVLMKEQPVFFEQCDISLKRIISDNKVDTKDIPEIITLVSKLYVVIKKTKTNSIKIDTYELIKTILHILFILHMQHHNIENDELTNSIINILDASIDLLKLNSSLKSLKTPNCLKCFMS